jgi:Ni/Fe-hydrogenase subunit HybB-like protein
MSVLLPVAAQHPPEEPVLFGNPEPRALTVRLTYLGRRPGFGKLLLVTGLGSLVLFATLAYTAVTGIGTWGNNIPVAWAFDITNFVWWIGIGHAGTFISAILFLLEQRWRTSINRFAEAMTLFAVANAAIFPLMHLGRPWFFYWLIPYPSSMGVWPQFRSALTWDVAAISTYGLISLLFWYLGLLPDLAAARDLSTGWKQRVYAFFALGWRGAARHWRHYRMAYLLLAGLATPLVLSVHSVVSMDFATAKVPGWHSTVFPPYFVAGAIFSGFAMVLTLLLPARKIFALEDVVTERHLDAMSKMLLLTGSVVAYAYLIEHFLAWYGGNVYEMRTMLRERPFGPYGWLFWVMVLCNAVAPQVLWSRRLRRNAVALFILSIVINVGMWAERFVIIAGSLATEYTPSSWHVFVPTVVDGTIFFGTLFFFSFLFLLFLRLVPFIPVSELKEMQHHIHSEAAHG